MTRIHLSDSYHEGPDYCSRTILLQYRTEQLPERFSFVRFA